MKFIRKNKLKLWISSFSLLALAAPIVAFVSSCSSSGSGKVENIINPAKNQPDFMKYGYQDIATKENTIVNINYAQVVKGVLETEGAAAALAETFMKNTITNWFAGIRSSKNFYEQYQEILENAHDSWEDTLSSYKDQHKSSWEYYLQTNVLDQYGGNIENYIFNSISSAVLSTFDQLVTDNINIGVPGENSLNYNDLFKPDGAVWSEWTVGQRNNICFTPPPSSSNQSFSVPISDFHEFIFDQYVREKMPIVTSMVLFKHDTTTNLDDFFDINEIANIPQFQDNTIVGEQGSYKWQAYPNPSLITSDGQINSSRKYLDFIQVYGNNGLNAVNIELGGSININTRYTDDSATLYLINLDDVFDTSYTPYAAASTYKFNTSVLGASADTNIATATTLKTGLDNTPGTEIMSNFLNTNASAPAGYFQLPTDVVEIMNSSPSTPGFMAKYNGVKSIADIVNIENTPFILARNESGVHIIGIDRMQAMQDATNFDQLINEIKNTLLWRHLISQSSESANNNGFSLDLNSEISNYYSSNKAELIFKYIVAKQKQRGTPGTDGTDALWESKGNEAYNNKRYIFSSWYTHTRWENGVPKFNANGELESAKNTTDGENDILIDPNLQAYLTAYYDYLDYSHYKSRTSTVTSKLLDTQSVYEGKWYTNAVLENGIAGMMSFTPSYSSGAIANDKLAFPSILQIIPDDATSSAKPTSHFTVATDKTKKESFIEAANTYFNFLNNTTSTSPSQPARETTATEELENNFTLRVVEYPQYEQKILLSSPNEKQASTNTYIELMIPISNLINDTYNSAFKVVVETDKLLAAIDDRIYTYNEQEPKVGLVGYNPTSAAPSIPSDNASAVEFVNYYIESAINKSTRIPSYVNNNDAVSYGSWINENGIADYSALNTIAYNMANDVVANKYNSDTFNYFKTILTLQYAFDWNPETGEYEFTKFRDYLYSSTKNLQKAAFVWKVSDDYQAFDPTNQAQAYGFDTAADFKFKNPIKMNNMINGYAFKGAPKIQLTDSGYYNAQNVTLNTDSSVFQVVACDKEGQNQYVGFQGIQFQLSNTLETQEANSLFKVNINALQPSAKATDLNWVNKGTLYNLGDSTTGKEELKKRIGNLQNNSQVNNTIKWFRDELQLDTKAAEDALQNGNRPFAKEELIALVDAINNNLFVPIRGEQIANASLINTEPNFAKFFGSDILSTTQMLVSQFNVYDVFNLFNTNDDEKIDKNDKGINWEYASQNGFLGTSAEAFFYAAYQWANSNQTYSSIAYNDMLDIQNNVDTKDPQLQEILVYVYSRPLNDLFGEKWLVDYIKPVEVK